MVWVNKKIEKEEMTELSWSKVKETKTRGRETENIEGEGPEEITLKVYSVL